MENQWIKACCIAMFSFLLLITGYQVSETVKNDERLNRMEVSVAVCGDVAAYFAPNDELTAGAELSAPRKVVQR